MLKTIMKAIDLSGLAYRRPGSIECQVDGFRWIEKDDTQCFICEDDGVVWVVFRGTEFDSLEDWITNVDCSFVHSPWGEVHKGFHRCVKSVEFEIASYLATVPYNKKIIFTGHSQGAAVAELLFSERCRWSPRQHQACIAIEPPRSMSKEAAEAFGDAHGSQMYHVVNNNDVVCRVPTRLMGYSHIKNVNLNYLDEDGNLHHDISWWERFKDRVKGRFYDFGDFGDDGVKDHSITEVQRIWRNLI